ncbi:MAG: response regulator transcription factor [Chloroflexota bacterium]
MTDTINIIITDDHEVVRAGLRAFISTEADIEMVGEASNGQEAIELVQKLKPDVILMDIVMPGMGGIEAIRQITETNPKARIVALTSFSDDDKVFPAIKAGALGYVLKDTAPDKLLQAIRHVYRGESSLDPTIAIKLIREFNRPTEQTGSSETLTEREVEVLKLVAQGLSNQEIAETLVITEKTVRNHVVSILGKLHLANRTQAALYALREGLASLN